MTSVRRRAPRGRCQAQGGGRAVRPRRGVRGSPTRRGRKGAPGSGNGCAKGLRQEGNRRPHARDPEEGAWPGMDPQEVRGASGAPKPWVSFDFIQRVMGSHRKCPTEDIRHPSCVLKDGGEWRAAGSPAGQVVLGGGLEVGVREKRGERGCVWRGGGAGPWQPGAAGAGYHLLGTRHSLWRERPVAFGRQPHDLAQPGPELAPSAHRAGHAGDLECSCRLTVSCHQRATAVVH